jgi:hypothetical protein
MWLSQEFEEQWLLQLSCHAALKTATILFSTAICEGMQVKLLLSLHRSDV